MSWAVGVFTNIQFNIHMTSSAEQKLVGHTKSCSVRDRTRNQQLFNSTILIVFAVLISCILIEAEV